MKVVIVLTLLWFFECTTSLSIVTIKDPPCDPVRENSKLVLTGISDESWDKCRWFKVSAAGDQENLVCVQYPGDAGIENSCRDDSNKTFSGGIYADRMCKLVVENVDLGIHGTWKLELTKDRIQTTTQFMVEVARESTLELLRQDVDDQSGTVQEGTLMEFVCSATDGIPRPDTFVWTIDGTQVPLYDGTWQAVIHPMELINETSISQKLSIVAPSILATYELQCVALEFDFNLTSTVNLTISVTSEEATVLSSDQIIIISLASVLFVVLVVVVVVAVSFCYRCLCFKKDQDPPKTPAPNPTISKPETFRNEKSTINSTLRSYERGVDTTPSAFTVPARIQDNGYTLSNNRFQQQSYSPVHFDDSYQPASRYRYTFSTNDDLPGLRANEPGSYV